MNEDARKALQVETAFLAGVESNFRQAEGRELRGTGWEIVRGDQRRELRALLAAHGRDPTALAGQWPCNRWLALHGSERRWWLGRRRTVVAVASVLAPLEHFASGAEAEMPPIELGELVDHVRGLVTEPESPHVIGVCSPSGFTDDCRGSQLELPNVSLVLVERRAEGGWLVTGVSRRLPDAILSLFDPEATSQKLDRVREEIERRRVDLLESGLNAAAVAERLDLPQAVVAEVFEQAAKADPELKVSRVSGEDLLLRRAPAASPATASRSVIDRIRALFNREGEEAEKIGLLADQRAGLAQRRDRLYEDLVKLEERETGLLREGRATASVATRRRLAAQLAHLRKEMARQNTTAGVLNSQIEIISTNIHHLTLIRQGRSVKLPDAEELTASAVEAQEMLERLKTEADLAAELERDVGAVATHEEELAILREFEGSTDTDEATEQSAPETAWPDEKQARTEEAESDRLRAQEPES